MNRKSKTPATFEVVARKRIALYARVSSEEQTRGNYPSCVSQVEEMEAACAARGWEVCRVIKDEGYSAGSLKRPGLSELRWLVETAEVDGVLCTWYDRLTRSRDFYILDKEFQARGVEFITLHDPTDTSTAAGRFMESVIVAAKTYDREQTAEKIRSKLRMRAEKGMWNGGPIPFGFRRDAEAKTIYPDPDQKKVVEQMFRVYVETASDFLVRDWLKAHQIPTSRGKPVWAPASVREVLTNRRYIAEVEINQHHKDMENLPESEAYRIARAPHEPVIPVELFELAQAVRKEKASKSPDRKGRPRSYSQTKCGRVYLLQGILVCGVCKHAMAPHYVYHRAGTDGRKVESFVNYYVCSHQMRNWKGSSHKNHVLARIPEAWIVDKAADLVNSEDIIERAIEKARASCEGDLLPLKETLGLTKQSLLENQSQIDKIVETVSTGKAEGALLAFLNERAAELKLARERLRVENRRLSRALMPLQEHFDAATFREIVRSFVELSGEAEPDEMQRLLRLMVRRIEWMPDGAHRVQYYHLPKPSDSKDRFYTERYFGAACRTRTGDPRITNAMLYQLS